MKNKSAAISLVLIFTLSFSLIPLLVNQASAQTNEESPGLQVSYNDQWWQINTSTITVLFPLHGQKPMFLWYYNDNSSLVYSVKYRGLVEYLPFNGYYTPDCESYPQTMQSLMRSSYGHMGGMHMNQIQNTIDNAYQTWESDFHPPYLPFSACTWQLTDPVQGTDKDGNDYVSFNMTLSGAPSEFEFAQNNIEFNCWLYENHTTLNPYGLGSYTIGDKEMEIMFSINNWNWNSNYMSGFFGSMHQNYDVSVTSQNDSLALWCDFATINMQDLNTALSDANEPKTNVPANSTFAPTGQLEGSSTMTDIIAGGHQIHMQNMAEEITDQLSVSTGTLAPYRMQFAQDDQTLPGFFNFLNHAAIVNPTTQQAYAEAASASYRTESNYMELFICYPYFGSNTLEHGPSIGIDTQAQIIPENPSILFIVIAVTLVASVMAVTAQRYKNKRIIKV